MLVTCAGRYRRTRNSDSYGPGTARPGVMRKTSRHFARARSAGIGISWELSGSFCLSCSGSGDRSNGPASYLSASERCIERHKRRFFDIRTIFHFDEADSSSSGMHAGGQFSISIVPDLLCHPSHYSNVLLYGLGPTRFTGEGLARPIYFTILTSHTILAALVTPFVIATL